MLCLSLVLGATSVRAEPLLQLDIVGGRYDLATQTIVSSGPVFQLVAVFTPKDGEVFDANALYYISAALTPQMGPTDSDLGSFTMDLDGDAVPTRTINATHDMEYGTPPIETAIVDTEEKDGGDLGQHGIYPTFFTEFAFSFSAARRTTTYNTQDSPGGLTPNASGGSYYQIFNVDVSGLSSAVSTVHFDLYDSYLRTQCMGPNKVRTCTYDEDIDHFAPFSHDASSGPGVPPPPPPAIPEPATLVLLASGLVISARSLRRRPAVKQ